MLRVAASILAAASVASSAAPKRHISATPDTSAIVSAHIYCAKGPCETGQALYISRLNTSMTGSGASYQTLEKLLPESVLLANGNFINTFTTYEAETRLFTVAATAYPATNQATFWQYTVADNIGSLTAVTEAVTITYPDSSSPAPLNIAPLKMARLLHAGSDAKYLAVFTNGEMHALDIDNKVFKPVARLCSDERLLSVEYPRATSSHSYDAASHTVHSVVMAASKAYTMTTDLTSGAVSEFVPLTIAAESPGDGFSSQTFVDSLMIDVQDGAGPRFTTEMMSLPNVGFDQITFVDEQTGVMDTKPVANMMEDMVYFQCSGLMCDSQRTSAYDAANKRIIFQGHWEDPQSFGTALYSYEYSTNKATGVGWWFAYTLVPDAQYPNWGMSGFQLVDYA